MSSDLIRKVRRTHHIGTRKTELSQMTINDLVTHSIIGQNREYRKTIK